MTIALGRISVPPRAAAALSLAFVVLLLAAGWLLLVSPKRSELSDLDAQISDVETQLVVQQHAQTAPKTLPKVALESVLRAMPDATNMPAIVLQLNALAGRAGVTLDSITPAPPTGVSPQAVPLTVVVGGRFFAVRSFLRALRAQVRLSGDGVVASGRLIDVQAIDLQQTEPAPQVLATLTLRAFVFDRPTAGAPTTSSVQAVGATG